MMNNHSLAAAYRNHVAARNEEKKMRPGDDVAMRKANTGEKLLNGSPDARFALIDYRDENKILAHRIMNRLDAFRINKRLENTGFAWARVSA